MDRPMCYSDNHYAYGQPTEADLAALAKTGVSTIINLRAADEPVDYDEAAVASQHGMRYVHLPITGPGDLDRARISQFGAALDAARDHGGVLIHCATANRVGAMVALDAAFNRGASPTEALALGRSAGLAGLDAAVAAML